MRLHLIRHTKPIISEGICYGQLDLEAENFDAAVQVLRAELPSLVPVWSSPLRRCFALAKRLHPAPIIDTRLAEMNFGQWEGRLWDDIPRAEIDAWAADIVGYAPPEGESPLALQRRAMAFVASLKGSKINEAVLVTHSGVIRTLVAHVQNLLPHRWCELNFGYASHTVLDFNQ